MNKIYILLITLTLLLSGCAGSKDYYMNRDKLTSLRIGMNKQQITKLYGTPHYRNIERNHEIWKYKYVAKIGDGYDFIEIRFAGEFVEGIDSYFQPRISCGHTRNTSAETAATTH